MTTPDPAALAKLNIAEMAELVAELREDARQMRAHFNMPAEADRADQAADALERLSIENERLNELADKRAERMGDLQLRLSQHPDAPDGGEDGSSRTSPSSPSGDPTGGA